MGSERERREIVLPPDWDEPSDFGPPPVFSDTLLPDGRRLVLRGNEPSPLPEGTDEAMR